MFGQNFTPKSRQQIQAELTPPSGRSQEAVWHAAFDTQTYVDNSTTRLSFFTAVQADKTLSNMEAASQFPSPQSFQIHNICLDAWTAAPVSTAATNVGNLNDAFLLLLVGRPVWTLTISGKGYGPYPVSVLHGTGGPAGNLGTAIATPGSLQFARNEPSSGWNYFGKIGIPEQTAFAFEVVWGAAQDLTANWSLRVTLMGVLNRRVL